MYKRLTESPFSSLKSNPKVYVARGGGPYKNTRLALSNIDLSPSHGKLVLLKPNAGRITRPGSGITTHPQVIAATIDAFQQAGAEVAIGESPIAGVKTLTAFKDIGITTIAKERHCPLLDMDKRPFIEVPVPMGKAIHTLRVCPEVFEFDYIISIPVMKMHMHTGVSLSVKNMKGCLWRRSKVGLHMLPPVEGYKEKPIDIAIADMSSVIFPHLAIIDGTVAMEGLGPSAGNPRELDLLIVSAEPYAADAVACALMGTTAQDIPHLRLGSERGFGVIDLEAINIIPRNWKDWITPLAPPPKNLSIVFPNITILDNQSCSACQSTLMLFLRKYGNRLFDYFPNQTNLTIAIGKGHQDLPQGTLCIGNCTAAFRDKGTFILGCPPVESQILAVIKKQG